MTQYNTSSTAKTVPLNHELLYVSAYDARYGQFYW